MLIDAEVVVEWMSYQAGRDKKIGIGSLKEASVFKTTQLAPPRHTAWIKWRLFSFLLFLCTLDTKLSRNIQIQLLTLYNYCVFRLVGRSEREGKGREDAEKEKEKERERMAWLVD